MAVFSVVSCMRNEAIFLLEWIAHHRLSGFDKVAVVTNDCTDGTDAMLDEIAAREDFLIHIPNEIAPGEAPQVAGMRKIFSAPLAAESDYMLHCDSDEFLQVSCGDGRVGDLIDRIGPADCIALAWRPFGDSGMQLWPGGSVIDKLRLADSRLRSATVMHKSLFRPKRFGWAIDHMPKSPKTEDVILINSRGDRISPRAFYKTSRARFREMTKAQMTWENACIHHYAIRSRDVFIMKNLRGDGMAVSSRKYHVGSTFWNRYNKNEVEVPEARRRLGQTMELVEHLRSIGNVRAIEQAALEDFHARRAAWLTPERIAEYTMTAA